MDYLNRKRTVGFKYDPVLIQQLPPSKGEERGYVWALTLSSFAKSSGYAWYHSLYWGVNKCWSSLSHSFSWYTAAETTQFTPISFIEQKTSAGEVSEKLTLCLLLVHGKEALSFSTWNNRWVLGWYLLTVSDVITTSVNYVFIQKTGCWWVWGWGGWRGKAICKSHIAEEHPCGKRSGGLCWWQVEHESTLCTGSQKGQMCPGVHQA